MKSTETTCKPLIFGLAGLELTEAERDLFTKNPVTGFILFKRNIESKEQLITLTSKLKALYSDHIPLILIDQEGGRVARLKPPLSEEFKPADFFGKMYDELGKEKACLATKENASRIMEMLQVYGIDSPCAPVADLRYEYTDKVIGDRSFGSNVEQVVALCSSFIEGVKKQGGLPIIKHMPGHGRATCDSHLVLPHVTTSLEELKDTDFEVFRQLSKNPEVEWAMTAHIVFDALDPDRPVTLSSKAIKFIREYIGFKGTIITDAIEMLALHGDIGTRYNELKKVTNIEKSQPISQEYIEILLKLGVIKEDFVLTDQDSRSQYLEEQYEQSKLDFTKSLCGVALSSFEAGCNIILHCTGDIYQMSAICEII